jgi:hypothetical protein
MFQIECTNGPLFLPGIIYTAATVPVGSEADCRPVGLGQCRFARPAARLISEAALVVANIVAVQQVVAENGEDLCELALAGHGDSPLHHGWEDVAKISSLEV